MQRRTLALKTSGKENKWGSREARKNGSDHILTAENDRVRVRFEGAKRLGGGCSFLFVLFGPPSLSPGIAAAPRGVRRTM